MKRILLLVSLSALAAACNLSQDLGSDESDGGTAPATSTTGTTPAPTSDAAPAPTVRPGEDGGPKPLPNDDAGADGSTLAPCPTIAGYPAAPYMKLTFTGGSFTSTDSGVRDTSTMPAGPFSPSVSAGHYASTPPAQADYAGKFLVNASRPSQQVNGRFEGPEWSMALLTEETGTELTAGTTYPIVIRYAGSGASPADAPFTTPFSLASDQQARYPGPGGTGSCTMTVDHSQGGAGKRTCMNARFSCTGLTGKVTGQTFDIVDGRFSYASR